MQQNNGPQVKKYRKKDTSDEYIFFQNFADCTARDRNTLLKILRYLNINLETYESQTQRAKEQSAVFPKSLMHLTLIHQNSSKNKLHLKKLFSSVDKRLK